ncbi:hypothetical protein ACET3Z_000792 [Daucus carota]
MIDMFSKCNRGEDAVLVFEYVHVKDSAICNSMISSYAKNGREEDALQLFVWTLRKDFKPTEFTLSSVISCTSVLNPLEHVSHFHCLVVKLGFESDSVVASSLVEIYKKASERILDLEPQLSLPYLVLAKAYERRGRWESLVRVRKAMEARHVKEMVGFSSVGIRNRVYLFRENQLLHCGGNDIYSTLRLLQEDVEHTERNWQMI